MQDLSPELSAFDRGCCWPFIVPGGPVNSEPSLPSLLLPPQHKRLQGRHCPHDSKATNSTQESQEPQNLYLQMNQEGLPLVSYKNKLMYTLWPYEVPPWSSALARTGSTIGTAPSLWVLVERTEKYRRTWGRWEDMVSRGQEWGWASDPGNILAPLDGAAWAHLHSPCWDAGAGSPRGHVELLRERRWLWQPLADPGAG